MSSAVSQTPQSFQFNVRELLARPVMTQSYTAAGFSLSFLRFSQPTPRSTFSTGFKLGGGGRFSYDTVHGWLNIKKVIFFNFLTILFKNNNMYLLA